MDGEAFPLPEFSAQCARFYFETGGCAKVTPFYIGRPLIKIHTNTHLTTHAQHRYVQTRKTRHLRISAISRVRVSLSPRGLSPNAGSIWIENAAKSGDITG